MLMKHFTLMNEFKAVVICTLLMSPIQSVLAENIAKGTCAQVSPGRWMTKHSPLRAAER